jgi:hypothetical protein
MSHVSPEDAQFLRQLMDSATGYGFEVGDLLICFERVQSHPNTHKNLDEVAWVEKYLAQHLHVNLIRDFVNDFRRGHKQPEDITKDLCSNYLLKDTGDRDACNPRTGRNAFALARALKESLVAAFPSIDPDKLPDELSRAVIAGILGVKPRSVSTMASRHSIRTIKRGIYRKSDWLSMIKNKTILKKK